MAVGGEFKHNTKNHQKMKQKRKRNEAIKGNKTISEIAGEFDKATRSCTPNAANGPMLTA